MGDTVIGPARRGDATALARLHREAFPGFFLSQLGERFLREFYRGFLDDPTAVTVVARDAHGRPVGAAVGTTEPAGFYKRLLRRRLLGLGIASALAAARHPQSIGRLLRGMAYRGSTGSGPAPRGALLSSICTAPHIQGAGLGQRLIAQWEMSAAQLGEREAHLSTDAFDNEGANAFYRQCGWRQESQYLTREGRRMNLFVKELI